MKKEITQVDTKKHVSNYNSTAWQSQAAITMGNSWKLKMYQMVKVKKDAKLHAIKVVFQMTNTSCKTSNKQRTLMNVVTFVSWCGNAMADQP